MIDMHVHSRFSHDGKSTIKDYSDLLERSPEIEAIGLAEHVDFLPECGGYGTFDTAGYLQEAAKSKFKGVRLFSGAEIDYSTLVESEIRAALKESQFDYATASVHIVSGIPFSTSEKKEYFLHEADFSALLTEYFHQVTQSLHFKEFDAIGHICIFKRYMERDLLENMGLTDLIRRQETALAKACAESGKIIEVNTSGFRSVSHDTFPDREFLRMFWDAGGRKVALGSDAHSIGSVCSDFPKALSILQEIGFTTMCNPWEH